MSKRVLPRSSPAALPPVVVAIAGLDPTGGAGLLADVAVIRAAGLHAYGIVTASTIQGGGAPAETGAVIAPKVLAAQLARLSRGKAAREAIAAIKIGLVPDAATAAVIATWLKTVPQAAVVWDPVLAASSGGALVKGSLRALVQTLAPALALRARRHLGAVAVITPNVEEARALAKALGIKASGEASHAALAPPLATALGLAVMVKGGHAPSDAGRISDVLVVGKDLYVIEKTFVPGGTSLRGTGCALSSLIASHLAQDMDLVTACCDASHALTDSMAG
ncbi:MAG: bifunctional hydroxymethylpyrimidine kinase/phosphomethylpyrimidine kinase [Myxococcales bacterium]|nr:bifunctional hydroxymethylpyrimidine kinase/phosphomethylpyrimidine kinase [Myxococcales bacterium]